jgi:hypothetical protein
MSDHASPSKAGSSPNQKRAPEHHNPIVINEGGEKKYFNNEIKF